MKHYTPEKAIKVFWSKVAITADIDRCWLWLASTDGRGYGKKYWHGKNDKAHRVSWMISVGEIPNGLWVLHKCDNRLCVNPKHLFLGTNQDNVTDRENKNRGNQPKGEKVGLAKLNANQVREIRKRYAEGGILYRELAAEYGVNECNIGHIITRWTWKHVK